MKLKVYTKDGSSFTEQDFENQRKAYRLIVDYLEEKAQYKIKEKEDMQEREGGESNG